MNDMNLNSQKLVFIAIAPSQLYKRIVYVRVGVNQY